MNLAKDQQLWSGKTCSLITLCSSCWPYLHHLVHMSYGSALIRGGHSQKGRAKDQPISSSGQTGGGPGEDLTQLAMMKPSLWDKLLTPAFDELL